MGDAPEGVLDARPCLNSEDAGASPVQGPRVAVGHVDGAPLHAGHYGAYLGPGCSVDDGAVGEAKKVLDSLLLQDVGDSVAGFHVGSSYSSRDNSPAKWV